MLGEGALASKAPNAAAAESEGEFMGIVSFALRFKHTF